MTPYDQAGELAVQQAQQQRQQQLAQALTAQSMQQPQGQMAGNVFVGPSWTQHLGNFLKGVKAENIYKDADEKVRQNAIAAAQQEHDQFFPGDASGNQIATPGQPAGGITQGSTQQLASALTGPPRGYATVPGMSPEQAQFLYRKNPEAYTKQAIESNAKRYESATQNAAWEKAQQGAGGVFDPWLEHPNPGIANAAKQGELMRQRGLFKDAKDMNDYVQKVAEADTKYREGIASNALTQSGQDLTRRGQDLTNIRGVESNLTTIRGQDLVNQRAAEAARLTGEAQKLSPGYRWTDASHTIQEKIPGGPATQPTIEQQKQATGVSNLSDAITEYRTELKGFGKFDVFKPDARATMGTKYNNMMLQAKEAYSLGVLNGNDYEILTSIVTDPLSAKGMGISKTALDKQASELDRIMKKIGSNAAAGRPGGAPAAPSAVPPGAAALLKSNPALRDQFDAKYGPGAAASVLGQ